MLRRNHVVQVELERLFENIPLRLPILLGNRNELIVELGVDLGSELFRLRGGHNLATLRLLSYLFIMINQYKSSSIHVIVNEGITSAPNAVFHRFVWPPAQ